ncbi:hypothetical protein [Frigoribacterium sp. Leaf186]|uniref:hypothetical protein n=1 Tax=Frigoribacterium sp. Leaf186 TaxID=1736293 RepID=UPI0006F9E6AA|nr:hypothetical protein [Frigoribacterium sp. Leaf186]KQS20828.1 hypothetical protein ASG05_14305 [Frigoribacterium sp. Leaf186]
MSDDHPDETAPDGTPSGATPQVAAVPDADERQEARAGWSDRVADIESQPLASRAAAFGAVHDELRAVLEGTTDDSGRDGR